MGDELVPAGAVAAADAARPAERQRLHAVDLMRVITVAGVIAVHVVSFTNPPGNVAAGAVTMLLHANREVFVCLTALVLAYGYSDHRWRPGRLGRFWARRYWLVGVPYVVWSVVYVLADGGAVASPLAWLRQLGSDLLSGAARYHLYFLLVTMQLYLVFPLLQQLIRATRGHHRALLVVSLILQLALTGAIDGRLGAPGLLGAWLAHPDALLPSYQLYVIVGMVMADHLEGLSEWVRRHWPLVAAGVPVAAGAAVACYLDGVYWGRLAPLEAARVFQPAVVVESLAVILGLYGLGVLWAGRLRRGAGRLVGEGADASFGIYLAHPLVLQGVLALAAGTGLLDILAQAPTPDRVALGLLGVVPLILVLSWVPVRLARSGWLSVPMAGRQPRYAAAGARHASPDGAPGPRQPGWVTYSLAGGGVAMLLAVRVSAGGLATTGLVYDDLPNPTRTASPAAEQVRPAARTGSVTEMHTVKVGTLERTYQVVRPVHPTAPSVPAIVVLHGISVGIDIEEQRDGLLPLATSGRAVLVYPVGYGQSWNAGTCCGSAQLDQVDDVAFVASVVHEVEAMPRVDPGAIALVGFSNGGRMAYRVVCEKPRLVSALAVVAAIPDDTCPPGPPVPLLQVAGSADPQINAIQLGAHVASWRARDGCAAAATTRTVGQLTLRRWDRCRHGTGIELATYATDAHAWPEGSRGTPPTAQIIWEFLTVPRPAR